MKYIYKLTLDRESEKAFRTAKALIDYVTKYHNAVEPAILKSSGLVKCFIRDMCGNVIGEAEKIELVS